MSNDNCPVSIYVIGPENGPYKIGYSQDTKARLSTLQTGQAVDLHLYHEQTTDAARAPAIEKLIHRQMAHKRIRGEWFAVDLDEAIAEVQYAFTRWEDEPALAFRVKKRLL